MEIRYSHHLLMRLKMRGIPENLPRLIYLKSQRRFFDLETNLNIAILRAYLFGKLREVAVSYRRNGNHILIITIHPLKSHQLENRLQSGRWKKFLIK